MRPLDMLFAILVAALWGGNFVAAKYGVSHFPPFFLTALRFSFVALLALPFVPRITRAQLPDVALLALVLGTLHFSLLFAGLYFGLDIPSCAIIGQMGVPFACLLGALFLKDRLGPWRILGMVIAFSGMLIVTGTPNILDHKLGFLATLAGTFFWGAGNIVVKRIKNIDSFQLLAWMAALAVPQLLLISFVFESNQWQLLTTTPPHVMLAVGYTAICSTIIAYGLWYYLLYKYPVSQVTPFSLLAPIFGIASGQLFFAATLTWQVLLGGAITIAGVAIIVIRRPKLMEIGEQI